MSAISGIRVRQTPNVYEVEKLCEGDLRSIGALVIGRMTAIDRRIGGMGKNQAAERPSEAKFVS